MPRILIADDNADLVAILSSRFRVHGYDVVEASDGADALEAIEATPPDVAVLDVMMPELNGYQVCRRLKEDPELSQVPVILLTAKDSEADKFWGTEVGADLYLTKPVEPADLVVAVERLMSGAKGLTGR